MRDDGKEFIIDNELWKIPNDGLEGWDYINPNVETENNAFGDGSYFTNEHIEEKDRTITAVLMNKNLNEVMRDVVRAFFGIKRTFKVYLTYMNTTRWCEGKIIAYSLPTQNIYDNLVLTITLLCPQPYLLSVDEFGKNIAEVAPRFGFPYVSLVGKGFIFSEYKFAKEVLIDNTGDVDTYAKIVITSKGDVTNPIIKKDDKFIKILDKMVEGDVIIIDLVQKPPRVTKNGKDIIGRTDRESSFDDMKFSIGLNKISFNADDGNNLLDVNIYYNERFGGI